MQEGSKEDPNIRVLINAITITDGGGLVVLKKTLEHLSQVANHVTWYVVTNQSILSALTLSSGVKGIACNWARKSPLHLIFWYEKTLPKLLKKINANLFLSYTNFLPRRSLACPTMLLCHNAGYFSDHFTQLCSKWHPAWKDVFLWQQKKQWAYFYLKRADRVMVQTQALADAILSTVKVDSKKISVIPHGCGLLDKQLYQARLFPTHTMWRIGYVTTFGVQKDFETAFKAIAILKQQNIQAKLILTLDPAHNTYRPIAYQINQYGIHDRVENAGYIHHSDAIEKLYESLDLFIFPSIIESFGFTLVEAMACGLPVIASDSASNKEMAREAGYFFPIGEADGLAKHIIQMMHNPAEYGFASAKSLIRAKAFCWHKTAQQLMQLINSSQLNIVH